MALFPTVGPETDGARAIDGEATSRLVQGGPDLTHNSNASSISNVTVELADLVGLVVVVYLVLENESSLAVGVSVLNRSVCLDLEVF